MKNLSKIKIVFLSICTALLFSQAAYSQISEGNVLIGGGFGFGASDNEVRFNLNPSAHYLITDNISIGGSIGLNTSRTDPGENTYGRQITIAIAPAVRYFKDFGDKLFIYGEGAISFNTGNTALIDDGQRTDLQRINQLGVGISPGILFTPTDRIGFDFNFSLISFGRLAVTDETADPTTTDISNSFSFGFDSFTPTFGVYYIIGN